MYAEQQAPRRESKSCEEVSKERLLYSLAEPTFRW
jgi:hypothetical protein